MRTWLLAFLFVLVCGATFAEDMAGGKVPLPSGAVLESKGQNADGSLQESYTTSVGGNQKYFDLRLLLEGWTLVAPLGPEDATDCGGDWGGIFEKDGQRFKLNVCGFDQDGASTKIMFKFFGNPASEGKVPTEKADEIHR
jgi:hypothetical protein